MISGTETHNEALREFIPKTEGPILELGTGNNSTQLIRELCGDRQVVSLESDPVWYEKALSELPSGGPFRLTKIESWTDLWRHIGKERFGLALLDLAPGEDRAMVLGMLRIRSLVDVIIVHDTEPESSNHYPALDSELMLWPFKKVYDTRPQTTVVSMGEFL